MGEGAVSGDPGKPPETDGGAERRGFFRLPRRSLVVHKALAFTPDHPTPGSGRLRDLSLTGVRFGSERAYDPGTLLQLELDLPGWQKERIDFDGGDPEKALEPLVVLAEVRWTRPEGDDFEIGALFVNIDEWHRKALVKYLEKLGPREAEGR